MTTMIDNTNTSPPATILSSWSESLAGLPLDYNLLDDSHCARTPGYVMVYKKTTKRNMDVQAVTNRPKPHCVSAARNPGVWRDEKYNPVTLSSSLGNNTLDCLTLSRIIGWISKAYLLS